MRYKREIELVFDIAALQQQPQQRQQGQSKIDLRYIAETPSQPPPEKEFLLHHIREHLRTTVAKSSSPIRANRVVAAVSSAWNQADAVAEHVRRLNLSFPTSAARTPDGNAVVTSSLLLVPLRTRVEVIIRLGVKSCGGDGEQLEVVVSPEARVMYGEQFNAGQMREFLVGRIGGGVVVDGGDGGAGKGKKGAEGGGGVDWDEAVQELYRRLLAKGTKVAAGQK